MTISVVTVVLTTNISQADVSDNPEADKNSSVPTWAADAIWYQVFISRFHNGNSENDPPQTLPWSVEWDIDPPVEKSSLREILLQRRYGGDIQGLSEKLPYLKELGVNTLYLNPVFMGISEHKYDTIDLRHIDDAFAIAGSYENIKGETSNPETWKWSASDRLFLTFLEEAHTKGFRVVIDGVFNHVGLKHWAWLDAKAHGNESPYASWFAVDGWGEQMRWSGWDRANGDMPEFNRADGTYPESLQNHLLAVVRRWMDPDGDGDPEDGIDGWRLDAAEKVPKQFWRRFRSAVKSINPQAIIVGEIWSDPSEWLQGDQFDTVTNYRLSAAITGFLAQSGKGPPPDMFADMLGVLLNRHRPGNNLAMVNVLGTHDTERVVSMLIDPQKRATEFGGKIPERDVLQPDEDAFSRMKLAVFLQFTLPGTPLIYYGDEVGMYGGKDPYCRAPMWWSDKGNANYRNDLLAFYKNICRLRLLCPELRYGRYDLVYADVNYRLFVFSRTYRGRKTVVIVNLGEKDHQILLSLSGFGKGVYTLALEDFNQEKIFIGRSTRNGSLWRGWRMLGAECKTAFKCPRMSAVLLSSGQ